MSELDLQTSLKNKIAEKSTAVRVGFAVVGLGALALLAPIIWTAVSAGVGLIVLALLAGLAVGVAQFLPLLGQKLENRVLAARKAEARHNPIEQLQNFLLTKQRRVEAFKNAVSQIGAQVQSCADMIDERRRKKPGADLSKQERSVVAMKQAHKTLVEKYVLAEKALVELRDVIEDRKFEWTFAQVGQEAIKNLNSTSGQDLLDQMLADEAYSSVRDNFNKVFADLEIEAAKLNEQKILTFDGGETIDVSDISLPQLETVRTR